MKRLTTFVFILTSYIVFSQQEKYIDSLNTIIKTSTIDTLKLQAIKDLTYIYGNSNKEAHRKLINQGIKLSRQINNHVFEADFISEFAYYFRRDNKLDSSFIYYKKAQNIFLKNKDSSKYYYVEYDLGNLKKDQGLYDDALNHFAKGITYFESQKSPKDKKDALVGRFNVATLYALMNNNKNAITEFETLLSLLPNTNENRGLIGVSNMNLTGLYIKEKQIDKALHCVKNIEKLNPAKNTLAHLYSNLGDLYKEKEDYNNAKKYFNKTLENFKLTQDDKGIVTANNNLGSIYILLGIYNLAEKHLLEANKLLQKTKNINSLQNNYNMMATLYEKKGNYNKALIYTQKEKQIQDSLFGLEKQKAIADFEVKYETEKTKREKETAEQQVVISKLESTKNRNLFIGSLSIAGLLLLSSLFYFGRMKAKKQAELITLELKETQKRLALEKQYRQSELKALKSQMDPHFIFNALNSIQEYIVLNQKNLASDYLGKFADLMRTYLHHSDKGNLSLQEEVDCLKMYLELEEVRFEDTLKYDVRVDKNLNAEVIQIPTMLVQPYVENALKHGLLHKKKDRELHIDIQENKEKQHLICVIKDNGIGRAKSEEIKAKRLKLHKSFATKATESRLALLNHGRTHPIGVNTVDLFNDENEPNGTMVTLTIPYTII